MSAPPGWYPQPDGQERFWDGERWTDEFRTPGRDDPTRPIETSATTAFPPGMRPAPGDSSPGASDRPHPSGPGPAGAPPSYGQPPYRPAPMGGYGPGAPGPPPRESRGKGCLIGALVAVVIVLAVGIVGLIWAKRAYERVVENPRGILPTPSLPSELPTDLPTSLPLPTTLPTPTGVPSLPTWEPITVAPGAGFDLGGVTVGRGWRLTQQLGLTTVSGMRATNTGTSDAGVVFRLEFLVGQRRDGESLCTAGVVPAGKDAEVVCVPTVVEPDQVDHVRVTTGR